MGSRAVCRTRPGCCWAAWRTRSSIWRTPSADCPLTQNRTTVRSPAGWTALPFQPITDQTLVMNETAGPAGERSQEQPGSVLLILNDAPYGSERSYNGLRLAGSLAARDGASQYGRTGRSRNIVGCAGAGKARVRVELHAGGGRS